MANAYHHSLSSVKHFGGQTEDYQDIHNWFDESKKIMSRGYMKPEDWQEDGDV
jgi:hypothetical protein